MVGNREPSVAVTSVVEDVLENLNGFSLELQRPRIERLRQQLSIAREKQLPGFSVSRFGFGVQHACRRGRVK